MKGIPVLCVCVFQMGRMIMQLKAKTGKYY